MRTSLAAYFLLAFLALASATGCGSSATTSTATGPTPVSRCAVTASGNGQVPAQGGGGSLAVTAARECQWSATADGQWLTIRSGASGQGDGAIEFNAAANPDPAVRRGAIVLNEQRVEVTQAAGECRYSLSEASGSFPQTGGSGQFEVRASSGLCSWTAQSDSPWVAVRAGASSQGTATVRFDVSAGGGPARNATITAAGLTFTVTQAAGGGGGGGGTSCAFSISPESAAVPSAGGAGTVAVTTSAGCPWTASSNAPWLTLTGAVSGNGPGQVSYQAAPGVEARSGTLTIAGRPFTVNQGAGCAYSLAPEAQNVDAGETTFNVSVTSSAGCPWSAMSNAPWISLDKDGGNGSGGLKVTVAPNPGPARSGTATIAGRTLTVNQAVAACSYKVSPLELKVNDDMRVSKIDVDTARNCSWTAVSNVEWIVVTLNSSGTGRGDVWILISENDGRTRRGTLTIAGQTVEVEQKDK